MAPLPLPLIWFDAAATAARCPCTPPVPSIRSGGAVPVDRWKGRGPLGRSPLGRA